MSLSPLVLSTKITIPSYYRLCITSMDRLSYLNFSLTIFLLAYIYIFENDLIKRVSVRVEIHTCIDMYIFRVLLFFLSIEKKKLDT